MNQPLKDGLASAQVFEFTAESRFEDIGPLVSQIVDTCRVFHANPGLEERYDTLQLCIAEAINNIVEHAYGGAPGHPVSAAVSLLENRIDVRLTDWGRPMPNGEPPSSWDGFDPDDLENLPEGGFGWMLIRSEMDDVQYSRKDDANVLCLTLLV